jgi:hypothetical protein
VPLDDFLTNSEADADARVLSAAMLPFKERENAFEVFSAMPIAVRKGSSRGLAARQNVRAGAKARRRTRPRLVE